MLKTAGVEERLPTSGHISSHLDTPECTPNAYKMVWSLRNTDVDNYQALADIADNSIDSTADASNIWLRIHMKNGEPVIAIADDGHGMDAAELDDAMRLGSKAEKDIKSDNGKFGVGLVLSAISIATQFQVITRGDDGYWTSRFDIATIERKDKFVLDFLRRANADEIQAFQEYTTNLETKTAAETGTVIILTDCDRMSDRNPTQFANTLAKRFRRIYRYHINGLGGGRKRDFYVNGKKLEAFDPLRWNDPRTRRLIDDKEYPFSFTNSEGKTITEVVRVRLAQIPNEDTGSTDKEDELQKLQGLYILRNYREIAGETTLGFWTQRREYNHLRGEIFFTGELDEAFGVNFQKQLSRKGLSQQVVDKLKPDITNEVNAIGRRWRKERTSATNEKQKEVAERVIKGLQEKQKFLYNPSVPSAKQSAIEKSEEDIASAPYGVEAPAIPQQNLNLVEDKYGKTKYDIVFKEAGESGTIYECRQEGGRVVIELNVQHVFYQKFVVDYLDEVGHIPMFAEHMVCCMALSELRLDRDAQKMFRPKFISEMSANLSVMLS